MRVKFRGNHERILLFRHFPQYKAQIKKVHNALPLRTKSVFEDLAQEDNALKNNRKGEKEGQISHSLLVFEGEITNPNLLNILSWKQRGYCRNQRTFREFLAVYQCECICSGISRLWGV